MNRMHMLFVIGSSIVLLTAVLYLLGLFDDTEYAPHFTEAGFGSIHLGTSEEDVIRILGLPYKVLDSKSVTLWYYGRPAKVLDDGGICVGSGPVDLDCTLIEFDSRGNVRTVHGEGADELSERMRGMTEVEVVARIGRPFHVRVSKVAKYFDYTRPRASGNYKVRRLGFDEQGKVIEKQASFYWD